MSDPTHSRDLDARLDAAWVAYGKATDTLADCLSEQLTSLVRAHCPGASIVTVRADHSHDAPHGHLEHIRSGDGTLLHDASSEAWHALPWAGEASETAWDLYHIAATRFTWDDDGQHRLTLAV